MLHSSVYIAIFLLVNLNYLIECGGRRQTACPKELNAFSVPNTTGNGKLCLFYILIWSFRVFCFNNDKLIDVCLNQVLLLLFLTASSDTRPNICSSNTSCCNKSIEDEMKTQITKRLMNLIHGRNERARRQFKDVYDDLLGMNIQCMS
jgi:hypothetical protein